MIIAGYIVSVLITPLFAAVAIYAVFFEVEDNR